MEEVRLWASGRWARRWGCCLSFSVCVVCVYTGEDMGDLIWGRGCICKESTGICACGIKDVCV